MSRRQKASTPFAATVDTGTQRSDIRITCGNPTAHVIVDEVRTEDLNNNVTTLGGLNVTSQAEPSLRWFL